MLNWKRASPQSEFNLRVEQNKQQKKKRKKKCAWIRTALTIPPVHRCVFNSKLFRRSLIFKSSSVFAVRVFLWSLSSTENTHKQPKKIRRNPKNVRCCVKFFVWNQKCFLSNDLSENTAFKRIAIALLTREIQFLFLFLSASSSL